MVFVSDTFTGVSGTVLESRTGETGATWIKEAGSGAGSSLLSSANRARSGAAASVTHVYTASGTPSGTEYDIEAVFNVQSNSQNLGVVGRFLDTSNTYLLRYNFTGTTWELIQVSGGVSSSLGTYSQTLTAGTSYTAKLEIRDAVKTVFIEGISRITSNTNVVTGAGKVGIRFFGASTNTTGYHLDSITATNAPRTISLDTTATQEAIGSPSLVPGAVTLAPGAIATAESIGNPTLLSLSTIAPGAIASNEVLDPLILTIGAVAIAPSSVTSVESVGPIGLLPGPVVLSPVSLGSGESVALVALFSQVFVVPNSVNTGEVIGDIALSPGAVAIIPVSMLSGEAIGSITLIQPSPSQLIAPASILTAETVGPPTFSIILASILVKIGPLIDKIPYHPDLNDRQRFYVLTTSGATTGLFDLRLFMGFFARQTATLQRWDGSAYLPAAGPIQELDLVIVGTQTYAILADPGQEKGYALHAVLLHDISRPTNPALMSDYTLILEGTITGYLAGPVGSVIATSPRHGLFVGATITHGGTTDYDGETRITAVTTDTYTFLETFTQSRTGTWRYSLPLPISVYPNGDEDTELFPNTSQPVAIFNLLIWRHLAPWALVVNAGTKWFLSDSRETRQIQGRERVDDNRVFWTIRGKVAKTQRLT